MIDPCKTNFFQINLLGRLYNKENKDFAFRDKECQSFSFEIWPLLIHQLPLPLLAPGQLLAPVRLLALSHRYRTHPASHSNHHLAPSHQLARGHQLAPNHQLAPSHLYLTHPASHPSPRSYHRLYLQKARVVRVVRRVILTP